MHACKLLAAGIGILLLGAAAVMPAQAGISMNGLTMNGVAAPAELGMLEVLSVTLPAIRAE